MAKKTIRKIEPLAISRTYTCSECGYKEEIFASKTNNYKNDVYCPACDLLLQYNANGGKLK